MRKYDVIVSKNWIQYTDEFNKGVYQTILGSKPVATIEPIDGLQGSKYYGVKNECLPFSDYIIIGYFDDLGEFIFDDEPIFYDDEGDPYFEELITELNKGDK